MRTNSKVAIAGAVLLIGVGGFWWETIRSRQKAEAALASLRTERVALQSQIREAKERATSLEQTRSDLARALEELQRTKSKAAASATKKTVQPRSTTDLIANNPKVEVVMLRWQREVVLLEYGPFLRSHEITEDQIRRFQDNWVRRVEQDIDLRALANLENGPGEEEAKALQQQLKDTYEAAQAEVLGAETYREWQEFQRTMGARNVVVVGLAGAATLQGVPLTAQQGQQLWQAAVESAGPKGATAENDELIRAIDWDALDVRAQQILTPAQYTLFKTSAAPSGFQSRWKYQLDSAVQRAMEADASAAR